MNITRHSEVFKAAAARVIAGHSTKEEEGALIGVKPNTFAVWMSRSGMTSRVNPDGTKKLAGAALGWGIADSDKSKALDDATRRVMSGELRASDVVKLYPELADEPDKNRATVAARVRRARVAKGLPVGPQGRRPQKPEQVNERLGFDVELR